MFRIWKIKAESRLDALLARLKPSPLMARALPLSLLASLLVAEPAFAQANFEGLADNILGLLSNGLLRTLAIIAIIVVCLAAGTGIVELQPRCCLRMDRRMALSAQSSPAKNTAPDSLTLIVLTCEP